MSWELITRRLMLGAAGGLLGASALGAGPAQAAAGRAKAKVPFGDQRPHTILHVSPSGDDSNPGTAARPLATIQAAADRAAPGVAVYIHAGTYQEAVKLRRFPQAGRDAPPSWFISADGPGRAVLRSPAKNLTAFKGLGVSNVVVNGLSVMGGRNGIQFSQAGADFSKICRNIVVINNSIRNNAEDGIKISQAENVWIVGNTVTKCADQCVDFVNVWDGLVQGNDLSDAHVSAGVFAKAGSQRIRILDNYVHHIKGRSVSGILFGGYSNVGYSRPGSPAVEVYDGVAQNNVVEAVEGYALSVLGGHKIRAEQNLLESVGDPHKTGPAVIGIGMGSPKTQPVLSKDVIIAGNTVAGEKREWLYEKKRQDPRRDKLAVRSNRRVARLEEGLTEARRQVVETAGQA